MPIQRETDSPGYAQASFEESSVRRAPVEQDDDAYELQDHEFTLEPDEPEPAVPGDEHTAPWSTEPPLPAWATAARELLEPVPAHGEAIVYDDEPTPAELSASEALALRVELAHARRALSDLERLERNLSELRSAFAAAHAELAHERGRVAGQALLIAELEQHVQAQATALLTAAPEPSRPAEAPRQPARAAPKVRKVRAKAAPKPRRARESVKKKQQPAARGKKPAKKPRKAAPRKRAVR